MKIMKIIKQVSQILPHLQYHCLVKQTAPPQKSQSHSIHAFLKILCLGIAYFSCLYTLNKVSSSKNRKTLGKKMTNILSIWQVGKQQEQSHECLLGPRADF